MKGDRQKIIIAVLSVALAIALIVIILLVIKCSGGVQENIEQPGQSQLDGSILSIDTPYGKLQVPSSLYDGISIESVDGKEIYSKVFSAEINAHSVDLYKVHFGEGADGDLMGHINNDGDTVPVYIEIEMLEYDESWTDEEKNTYEKLMDTVNDVYQSLSQLPGFTVV